MRFLVQTAKRFWINHLAEPVRYRADYGELERTYRTVEDPWSYGTSVYERTRFEWLLRRIGQLAPRHGRILEIGCGEGHFTRRLTSAGYDVTAVDVCATALERAQRLAPEASYRMTALEDLQPPSIPYDVVLACDVLYYLADPAIGLRLLEQHATCCLVSYALEEAPRLDVLLADLLDSASDTFTFPWNLPTPWGCRAVWWPTMS